MVKEKQKLTLSVDKEVVEKAKKLDINISDITEKVLTGYTSAENPKGTKHEAYEELFKSILPLLKEFDCKVQIAASWDYVGEHNEKYNTGATYLMADGRYREDFYPIGQEDFFYDIKKIPADDFLSPKMILSRLVNELARNQETRQEKMKEILMAKRIVEAMSKTLLEK